jgi:hypothetical protein
MQIREARRLVLGRSRRFTQQPRDCQPGPLRGPVDLSCERVSMQIVRRATLQAIRASFSGEPRVQQHGVIPAAGCGMGFGRRQLRLQVGQASCEEACRQIIGSRHRTSPFGNANGGSAPTPSASTFYLKVVGAIRPVELPSEHATALEIVALNRKGMGRYDPASRSAPWSHPRPDHRA